MTQNKFIVIEQSTVSTLKSYPIPIYNSTATSHNSCATLRSVHIIHI